MRKWPATARGLRKRAERIVPDILSTRRVSIYYYESRKAGAPTSGSPRAPPAVPVRSRACGCRPPFAVDRLCILLTSHRCPVAVGAASARMRVLDVDRHGRPDRRHPIVHRRSTFIGGVRNHNINKLFCSEDGALAPMKDARARAHERDARIEVRARASPQAAEVGAVASTMASSTDNMF